MSQDLILTEANSIRWQSAENDFPMNCTALVRVENGKIVAVGIIHKGKEPVYYDAAQRLISVGQ